ncbi:uncharacterized protein NDAI_0J00210 [Naumovozyma dairenensis CBS 421]|uniref:Uncharacterized protein n=1 Tax=Naumovozyma dairenensis (strain ATCC 10597 / BCRC 20456 / CBS 421 / NBRC 0211 / NRRL Y-12639) TaxID=1071378 RepID=G0WHD3_NAUDC|nr:hypothetical protein NDAI_0J00210 [Naumovozyma dairenensis CBS 421]CCD26913.1 hypothetical protein NDAI_0J00210 [Naumovozyma dairenensis CBS 421]
MKNNYNYQEKMNSNTSQGLVLREKAAKNMVLRIYTQLKRKIPFCKKPVKYWILDEPNSFKVCPYELGFIFKYDVVRHYLKSNTPFYSSVSNTEYKPRFPFHRKRSKMYDPQYFLKNGISYNCYMLVGPDMGNRTIYFSTAISEDGMLELNISLSLYKIPTSNSDIFANLNIHNGDWERCNDMPRLADLLNENEVGFLPPSDFAPVPCQVLFYHFQESDAIIYRDLFVVYRNRAIKRGYMPNFPSILEVFLDPPYEIFIMNVDDNGNILQDKKEEYNEVYHDCDVTWAERHCYQKYFVCKVNQMIEGSSRYFTLSYLQDHLERNPVFHRKGKTGYKITTPFPEFT